MLEGCQLLVQQGAVYLRSSLPDVDCYTVEYDEANADFFGNCPDCFVRWLLLPPLQQLPSKTARVVEKSLQSQKDFHMNKGNKATLPSVCWYSLVVACLLAGNRCLQNTRCTRISSGLHRWDFLEGTVSFWKTVLAVQTVIWSIIRSIIGSIFVSIIWFIIQSVILNQRLNFRAFTWVKQTLFHPLFDQYFVHFSIYYFNLLIPLSVPLIILIQIIKFGTLF